MCAVSRLLLNTLMEVDETLNINKQYFGKISIVQKKGDMKLSASSWTEFQCLAASIS